MTLFREEAVKARRTRLYGQVLIATPISFKIVAGFLLAILLGLIVFLSTASFARIETVPGAVVPTEGVVQVRSPSGGVVTDLSVEEGRDVERGDVLGRIVVAAGANDVGTLMGAQLAAIDSRLALVDRRIEQTETVNRLETEAAAREADDAALRLAGRRALLDLQKEVMAQAKAAFDRAQDLADRDLKTADAVTAEATRFLGAQQDVERLELEIAELVALGAREDLRKSEMAAAHALALTELQVRRAEILAERDVLLGEKAFDIVAPASGRATAVLVAEGFDIDAGRTLFSILPRDSELQVELYVPSRAIGFIEPGQSVSLQYDAFPYQRFGAQTGAVREITRSVIMPGERDLLIDAAEPVYRVTVALPEAGMPAYDREFPIQPGMLLQGNVVLEERSILLWLLDPLIAVARRTG